MTGERFVIVTADDFGRSAGVNAGVARAFEDGIVTSASLMVRWPAAAAAAAYARDHPDLAVGLHVDLCEWRFERGDWVASYVVVDDNDTGAVRAEVERQVDQFHAAVGRGPTHVDSHQHVHRGGAVAEAVQAAARELAVPLREGPPGIPYVGAFYGQDGKGEPLPEMITEDALIALVTGLPPGWSEVACHPGASVEPELGYAAERPVELAALCSPRVRAAVSEAGVILKSFADVAMA